MRAAPAPMLPGESLGAYRKAASTHARRKDLAWAAEQVGTMPNAWAARLLRRWAERYHTDASGANLDHLRQCGHIKAAQVAGVQADATDAELCDEARRMAAEALRRVQEARGHAVTAPALNFDRPRQLDAAAVDIAASTGAAWALARWFDGLGLGDLWAEAEARARSLRGLLARATCDRFWRRILRRLHARAVESVARSIGLVHRRAGCYVSNESLRRRIAQNQRNAAALESVEAVNERAQRYTLADLAAKGTANKAIRRQELMTRIAGFELIARDLGHAALFVTVTCPSRMHAWRTKPGTRAQVEPNPAHDGTRPDEAQRHLARCWARFRAAAARAGLGEYGFRIAEPNHDGTPHWHALLFFPAVTAKDAEAEALALQLLRRYFLDQCDPHEPGAQRHRVTCERIDWTKGSAAGYVAKYVAKNIDGMHVGEDLEGNPALESSARVEAWAATWRVRQFQQVGGAPVGVWRELRRVHPEQGAQAQPLAAALCAVNGAAWHAAHAAESEAVERYSAANGWRDYLRAQGGHRVRRRDLRIRVMREQTGEIGRYGEPVAPAVVGVQIADTFTERRPAFGIVPALSVKRTVLEQVEAERSTWIIVPKGIPKPPGIGASHAGHTASPGGGLMGVWQPAAAGPAGNQARGEALRPWSPVNNCTDPPPPPWAPAIRRHRKVGRWADWSRIRTGGRVADVKG